METIFVLTRFKFDDPKQKGHAVKLIRDTIGYFTSLDDLHSSLKQQMDPCCTLCYIAEEFVANSHRVKTIRCYDGYGALNDYSLIPDGSATFKGRKPSQIRFHRGDIVRYIDSDDFLRYGIVSKPPLSTDEYAEVQKTYKEGPYLVRDDDFYCILDADKEHVHTRSWQVFPAAEQFPVGVKKQLFHSLTEENKSIAEYLAEPDIIETEYKAIIFNFESRGYAYYSNDKFDPYRFEPCCLPFAPLELAHDCIMRSIKRRL